ncbi:glycosyltransferase [Catenulispora sp. NF23]|uniref:Glycosyltransferase n=1 Tax=Catenulispora pinistramenti TaxID=2705254 RepID=A0ABS5KQE9_9ACTN|nr:glycosyltransferase [Catenulispora pinistramenti]MBS2537780.1 glycosyltransferase [Catenulispora pinistramenti]MBS2548254.1 glycosyltransferase [Catenulispora pinistramenti]
MPTIAAVATAFHPDERLTAVVEAALKSCERVVVVDNTPGDGPFLTDTLRDRDGVTVLRDGGNRGLAGALNSGVEELLAGSDTDAAQPDLLLFLDQDSVLGEDMVLALARHLTTDATIGIAAPAAWDEQQGRYYEPGTENGPDLADRDTVITSGMLVRREVLTKVGPFRTEFFVDHVDNDFCLRTRAAGYRILRDKRQKLAHSLGQRNQHKLPGVASVSSSRHPTWRLYWIARNGTVLMREHRKDAPAWTRNTAAYLVWWFALRTAIEAPRGARALAMMRGFRDGARGRVDRRYLPPGAVLSNQRD